MNSGYAGGGYTGDWKHEAAGIVHPAHVFLPRATYDQLGEEAVRKLAGPDAEVTIIEADDEPQ
jgi:hypothetical protein